MYVLLEEDACYPYIIHLHDSFSLLLIDLCPTIAGYQGSEYD